MAAIIRIKRSTGTSAPGSLKTGELAYSAGTGTFGNGGDRLYFGKGDDGSGNATSVVVIGGEYFSNLFTTSVAVGIIEASKVVTVDASKKVDEWNVDNIKIDGNSITSTDTNGNINLNPDGTGTVDLNNTRITSVGAPTAGDDATNKTYVDYLTGGTPVNLNVTGDSGTISNIVLQDSSFSITGSNGISTQTNGSTGITIKLDATGATAGTYGSATEIPVFTVNAQGQLDSAGTVSVATTLLLGAETGSGSVDLLDSSMTIAAGEGINTSVSGSTITIAGELADSNNKGIAQFVSDDFSVAAGEVSLVDTVIKTITTDTGTLTPSGHGFSIVGGEGMDVTHTSNTITVAGEDADSNNKGIASFNPSNFTVSGGAVSTKNITLGSSVLINGTITPDLVGLTNLTVDNVQINGNTISSTDGSNTLYIDPSPVDSDGGDLIIRGNLIVQGTQTTVNSTVVSLNDIALVLADSAANAAAADGAGIIIGGDQFTGTKPQIIYDAATNRWDPNIAIDLPDSIGGASLYFAGTQVVEAIEDHLATNVFLGHDSSGQDITYDDNAGTITFSNQYASLTNVGTASFGGWADSAGTGRRQFSVSAKGNVTIAELDGGTY